MPRSADLHFSLEIFSEQISKAYGQAVSYNLVHSSAPSKPKAASAGLGAVVISRKIPYTSLNNNAVLGRPECSTSIRPDPVMNPVKIQDLLTSTGGLYMQELEAFINENFFCATKTSNRDGITLTNGGNCTAEKTTLTDVFVVKNKKKDKKIRFVGTNGHSARMLTFAGVRIGYKLSFSYDREFGNVLLCRVTPALEAVEDDNIQKERLWVYETLFIFNSLKYCLAECVPFPGIEISKQDTGDSETIKYLIERKAQILDSEATRYLKTNHALKVYFPRGAAGKLQNKSSIVYVKDFLATLARLHYAYNALLSISAAMIQAKGQVGATSGSRTSSLTSKAGGSRAGSAGSGASSRYSVNAKTKTFLDEDILSLRASIRRAMLGADSVDVEYCKNIELVHDCIAAAADYVSDQYKGLVLKETDDTLLQLNILRLADPDAGQWSQDKLRDNYGYLLVRNLLKNIPVITQNMQHSTNRNKQSPLEVNLFQIEPYTGATDYGDAWTLKIYYTAYHREFLNLAPWVSADGKTPPAWMTKYYTHLILPNFDAEKIGEADIYNRVVPTRLNYGQKVEITVHTFLRDLDGARVKNDKKKKLPKKPAA